MNDHAEGNHALVPGDMRRRARRLLCPLCGRGRPFRGWFTMLDSCTVCGFRFDREPGYFLGAFYINYGLCAGAGVLWAVLATFVWHMGFWQQIVIPALLMIVMSCWLWRYARLLWLAFDLSWDPPRSDEFHRPHDTSV